MSRITKFIFHPKRFFLDAISNRKKDAIGNREKTLVGSRSSAVTFNVSRLNMMAGAKVLLHSGEGQPGEAHMRMWIKVFDESCVPFAVLTRIPRLYEFVKKEWPYVSVALASTAEEVEEIVASLTGLKCVCYPSNTGNNIHLIRFNHLDHIFIGHGDSDKSGSAHKFFRAYDQVWTAGQAHIDRFKNSGVDYGHLRFLKVGRPNLRPIIDLVDKADANLQRIMLKRPNILYIPTWEGTYEEQNYSSIGISGELLRLACKIANNASILIKFHPMTGRRNKALVSAESQLRMLLRQDGCVCEVIDRSEPLHHHLMRANVFICDNSAAITECLSVDAPIFVYMPEGDHLRFAQSDMPPTYYAYVFSSVAEFLEKFEGFMSGGDTLMSQRAEAREYLLGLEQIKINKFAQELSLAAGLVEC